MRLIIAGGLKGQIIAAAKIAMSHGAAVTHTESLEQTLAVLRGHESMVEAAEELVRKLAAEHGFTGKLIVLGQSDITPGDGRIEWAEGGFVLDSQQLAALVEQAVARVFGHGQS